MTREESIAVLEEILELDKGELQENSVLGDYEEWDSLSKLALMSEVKKLCGKKLTQVELQSFETVKDICDYMEK